MHVIGVGFGRTGTASLKEALERLGIGPCYHMQDVLRDPSRARAWLTAAEQVAAGGRPDWEGIFAGYSSTVDWPGSSFWRELVAAYPSAKAILTVRDPQRWYDSMESTILRTWRARRERAAGPGAPLRQPAAPPSRSAAPPSQAPPSHQRDFAAMTDEVVARRVFAGRADEREYAIATYGRHVAEVRATVPAERLLVFEVAQGWAPLCAFLEVPEPDEPFPRVNDKGAFNERQATSQGQAASQGQTTDQRQEAAATT